MPERRAVSSAVEHCFHTAGVTGSNPVPPTIKSRTYAPFGTSVRTPYGLKVVRDTVRTYGITPGFITTNCTMHAAQGNDPLLLPLLCYSPGATSACWRQVSRLTTLESARTSLRASLPAGGDDGTRASFCHRDPPMTIHNLQAEQVSPVRAHREWYRQSVQGVVDRRLM